MRAFSLLLYFICSGESYIFISFFPPFPISEHLSWRDSLIKVKILLLLLCCQKQKKNFSTKGKKTSVLMSLHNIRGEILWDFTKKNINLASWWMIYVSKIHFLLSCQKSTILLSVETLSVLSVQPLIWLVHVVEMFQINSSNEFMV